MKRLHVHVAVADLARSIGFYSAMFGASPTVEKVDYAKWLLEDPRVNFAISARGLETGLNHLGIQVEDAVELAALRLQFERADLSQVTEGETVCCYARSDKTWLQDPSGIAWEAYQTMGEAAMFNALDETTGSASPCCIPKTAAPGLEDEGPLFPSFSTACCTPRDPAKPCC